MRQLPGSYVLNKFYTLAGEPTFRKFDGIYNASCPICREGKSWLKKKRLYFYPSTSSFFCFNCNKAWSALNWISEAGSLTREEVELEAHNQNFSIDITNNISFTKLVKRERPILPHDSININDVQQ